MSVIKLPKKSTVRNLRTRLLTVVIVAVLGVTSVFAASTASYSVQVNDGEQTYEIRTGLENPDEIIASIGLAVAAEDRVDFSRFHFGEDSIITIQRAIPVTVIDGEVKNEVKTVAKTVAELLRNEKVNVAENDIINHAMDAPITEDMAVIIKRTFPITVTVDGKESVIYARGGSVGTTLFDAGITVAENDVVQPAEHLPVWPGTKISVNRAQEVIRTEKETIAYSVEKESTNTLYQGEKKKVHSGKKGQKQVVYKDLVVNGEVMETSVVSEEITKKPTAEKWLVGTKKRPAAPSADKSTNTTVESKPVSTPLFWLQAENHFALDPAELGAV